MKTALRLTVSLLLCLYISLSFAPTVFAEEGTREFDRKVRIASDILSIPERGTDIVPVEGISETAAFNASLVASGTSGMLEWKLYSDGLLAISGEGWMSDFTGITDWLNYSNKITRVWISSGVASIGKNAFSGCPNLAEVHIPDTVTSIGDRAFFDCSSLTDVTIPACVTSIGGGVFASCKNLTGISVEKDNPSYCCDEYGVLYNKAKTQLVQAPGTLNGEYTIPSRVTIIGHNAFFGCSGLTSVSIPSSVTSIGQFVFVECDKLTGIWVSENNSSYCSDQYGVLYNKVKSHLVQAPGALSGTYTIPSTVTIIDDGAFCACSSLTNVIIPASVTSIGAEAFNCCSSLTSVTIPANVTRIEYATFVLCSSLTNITIPANMTYIGYIAFLGCSSLKDVYYSETQNDWNQIEIDEWNDDLTNATIHFGQGILINSTNFPDQIFRSYVSVNIDKNGDGRLDKNERNAVKKIDCTNMSIRSAKGIEFFPMLNNILFMGNQLDSIDTSGFPDLFQLSCGGNQIKSLNLSNNTNLKYLYCWGNQLKELDLSNNPNLLQLYCQTNQLTSLDLSNLTALQYANCSNNSIAKLDLSQNPELREFNCGRNRLTSLDVSKCSDLQVLYCFANSVKSINIRQNRALTQFNCSGNQISSLDVSQNTALKSLFCHTNQLTSLDISHNPELISFSIGNNRLESIDLRGHQRLENLSCYNNRLISLDLSQVPNLKMLHIDRNPIKKLDLTPCPALVEALYTASCWVNNNIAYYRIGEGPNPQDSYNYNLTHDESLVLIPNQNLVLPASLTAIEDEAFIGGAFVSVQLSENTKSIGQLAFADCKNLRYIRIPNVSAEIDPSAFVGVSGLTIIGVSGSTTQAFAEQYGYTFVAIS